MRSPRWVGDCLRCGAVDVAVSDVRLVIGADAPAAEFTCPSCASIRVQPVDPPTAELFLASGVEVIASAPERNPTTAPGGSVEPREPAQPADPSR
jgi:hypothetical protein